MSSSNSGHYAAPTIIINGTSQTFPPDIPDAQAEILTHLGIVNGVLKMT